MSRLGLSCLFMLLLAGSARLQAAGADTAGYDWAKWSRFWSFQAVKPVTPPALDDADWTANPIDAFVLAKLQSTGLKPSPPADRTTLIRRATFDLTGLPPTATEIRDFLADRRPDAYERLIDRLLASPHYGEKWGRHWLDIARYVPGRISFPGIKHTAGDQAYRDYVVRAFNADKPYDVFLREQLAGDLLPPSGDRGQQFDQIVAPAFLSIGPWFDECTDPNRLRLEIVDDMIATTSQAFLGLSVQCARCHDHKFDPVPTADYYAMAGIFGSTRVISQLNDYWRDGRVRLLRPLAMPDEVKASEAISREIEDARKAQWALLNATHQAIAAELSDHRAAYASAAAELSANELRIFKAESFDGEHNLRIAQLGRDGIAVNILESMSPLEQWVKYKLEAKEDGHFALDALYCSDDPAPVAVAVNGATVAKVALNQSTGGWDLEHQRWERVAEFDLRSGLNFLRMEAKEGTFPRLDRLRLYRVHEDDPARLETIAREHRLNPQLLRSVVLDPDWPCLRVAEMRPYLSDGDKAQFDRLDRKVDSLEKQRATPDLAISVADEPKPQDSPIHVRGDVYQVSAHAVPRGIPRLLQDALPSPSIPNGESGRLELAQWLTDSRNPLTARVMVNRIWQWHFGRGIVATPSDFGSRGEAPSHPELLDYLAEQFVSHGWSIKWLHRQIMLSRTYQLSGVVEDSSSNQTPSRVDPDNRLLSHFTRRRLEAEELYDAMLGAANLVLPQPAAGPLDVDKSKNRAMYVLASNRAPQGLGPEIRKMFPLFDADLSGAAVAVRSSSTTPAQGLFWLNSPIPRYFAGRFAERLLKMDKLTDRKRVDMAFLLATGRSPAGELGDASLEFVQAKLAAGLPPQDAWAAFCQAIFASESFQYVD